jgi:hypothetical protein
MRTDEIGKVKKEEKSNIIDFNDEEESAEVSNEVSESCKRIKIPTLMWKRWVLW